LGWTVVEDVTARTAPQDVLTVLPLEIIIASTTIERVSARPSQDAIEELIASISPEGVVSTLADYEVLSSPAPCLIRARAKEDFVKTGSTAHEVSPFEAPDLIVTAAPDDDVTGCGSEDVIRPARADDRRWLTKARRNCAVGSGGNPNAERPQANKD
jgi:hypothetical protein